MATRVVRRLDLGELCPPTRRDDGTIRVDAFITRCGIFNYAEPDGTIRRELREPDQVNDPVSLASFSGVPVTNEHPPEMLDAKNARKYAVGSLQGDVRVDDDHLRGKLAVYDHDTIADMEAGRRRQVSAGYLCDLDETPGVHPVYGAYDARQLNIRANHIAIVETARAGNTARVRLDAAERVDEWSDAAREASAEARKAGAQGPHQASGVERLKEFAKNAFRKKPGEVAKEIEKHGKEYEARKSQKPPKMSKEQAKEQFEKLREAPRKAASAEWDRLRAEKAKRETTSALAKYVTKKDAGILGLDDYLVGTLLAPCKKHAMVRNMAADDRTDSEDETKPQGGKPASKDPDPKDEANRSAKGENDAKPKNKASESTGADSEDVRDDEDDDENMDGQPQADAAGDEGRDPEDPDDDEDDDDPDDDGDDDEHEDAYTTSYDEDGKLTDESRHKMATSNFAVPDREGLPIHDPDHCRAAMSRFGKYDFKNPEEKHAAFNRIGKRAKQFGVSTDGFDKAHRQTLDRQDSKMNKLHEANKRADAAETALAKAQGELASLKKDVETLTAKAERSRADAADGYSKAVASKVALLAEAGKTGAKVDASMKDIEIKRTTVKHVDGIDVPADKPEAYVDAMYDGAIRRFTTDAKATIAGADALGAARKVVVETRETVAKNDSLDDEAAAAAAARARNAVAHENWAPKHTRKENS